MNMKKILYLICTAALSVIAGCSDFLTEKTDGQIFSNALETEAGLEAALTGTYKKWSQPWSCGFQHTWPLEVTMGGEDITSNAPSTNCVELDTYAATNTNSSVPNVYRSCYQSIINASSVIEAALKFPDPGDKVKNILAEAYFIRAYDYFWLGRMHKAVPLILSGTYNEEDAMMPVTGTEGIYAQIESDLEQAIALLPDQKRNGEPGRPNKGTAYALRAEVWLMEAGFPLNRGDEAYRKAAADAREVLDNRSKYGFDFEESYETLFTHSVERFNGGVNKESVFVMTSDNANWMYGTAPGPSDLGGWGYIFAETNFYKEFPGGIRKEYTFDESFDFEHSNEGKPIYRKLSVDDGYTMGGTSVAINYLRFSQTALTYAEAKARTDGPDDLAYACVNTIRRRAGLDEYSGLDRDDFVKKCVEERKWEFAAEGVRWWDVIRLDLIQEAIACRASNELPVNGAKSSDNYFLPLPNTDEILNPNINK